MCTFTITEKGYNLNTPDGNFMAAVAEDMKTDRKDQRATLVKLLH